MDTNSPPESRLLCKYKDDATVVDYIPTCYSKLLFFNTITKPTRVTSLAAIIDHIWSNNCPKNILNDIIYVYSKISDNVQCLRFINMMCNNKTITYRDYSCENITTLKNL